MWSLNRTLFSKPAVFGAIGVECIYFRTRPKYLCPPKAQGWKPQYPIRCLYDGAGISSRWTGAGNWEVSIVPVPGARYTYADAKARCSLWGETWEGTTLVQEQDALDAVRFWCQYLVTLSPTTYMEFADNGLD